MRLFKSGEEKEHDGRSHLLVTTAAILNSGTRILSFVKALDYSPGINSFWIHRAVIDFGLRRGIDFIIYFAYLILFRRWLVDSFYSEKFCISDPHSRAAVAMSSVQHLNL